MMISFETKSLDCRSNTLLVTPARRLRSVLGTLLAVTFVFAGLAGTASAQADRDQQSATLLVLLDLSYMDPSWVFEDEVVGILLNGNDFAGADEISCSVSGFEGGYSLTDATLVTKHGGRMPYPVYVRQEVGVLLPAHGFIRAIDIQDVRFYQLVDTANNLSENKNGGYLGFFVTVSL